MQQTTVETSEFSGACFEGEAKVERAKPRIILDDSFVGLLPHWIKKVGEVIEEYRTVTCYEVSACLLYVDTEGKQKRREVVLGNHARLNLAKCIGKQISWLEDISRVM